MIAATLGEVAEWGSGGTPRRSIAENFGTGVPWLSIADLNDGVVFEARESLTQAGLAASAAKVVPAGTLFVAMYGSIGKLGIAGREMCTSQAIAYAKPRTDRVDTRFLFHYLLSQRSYLKAAGRGGTQMNIGQSDLKTWPISVPSLEEQRRLAAILDHADALRAKRRQILAHVDTLAQSIFLEMFGGGLADVQRSDLRTLAQVVTKGTTPTSVGFPFTSSGVPFLRVQNLHRGTVSFDADRLFIDVEAHNALRRSVVHPNDLLISIAGTIGRVALVPDSAPEMNCNQAVAIVRLRDPAIGPWLMTWLQTRDAKRQMEVSAVTGTISNLSLGQIGRLRVPVPNTAAVREFDLRRLAVRHLAAASDAALKLDDELFASLQHRAFHGEV